MRADGTKESGRKDGVEITDERVKKFSEYLLERECSHNTNYAYRISLRKYVFVKGTWLDRIGLLEFKNDLLDTLSPKTINTYLSGIIHFARFCGHPEIDVKKVKVQRQLAVENIPTKGEYDMICRRLSEAGEDKKYWMIVFLAKTGARASEFVKLRKGSLERGYQDIWNKGKMRRVYVPKSLAVESRWYFDGTEGEILFPGKGGEQMTVRGLEKAVHMIGEECGIRAEVCHPHAFRHYFAVNFLENGGDLQTLSNILGHQSITTTAIYTQKSLMEQMDRLDRISAKW